MKKIKVSWSILKSWSMGYQQEAIDALEGKETNFLDDWDGAEANYGKHIHDRIAKERLRLLPKSSANLVHETAEGGLKYLVEINDEVTLSFKIDTRDLPEKTLMDYKTGNRESNEHDKMQVYVYGYGLMLLGDPVDYGIIAKVDESVGGMIYLTNYSVYKLTDQKYEEAHNFIMKNTGDILDYYKNKLSWEPND